MHDPDNTPETLIAVPNDLEAAMIVSALAARDANATTAGEYTSGFRAEAPGLVKVLVRQCDLQRAREVLDKLAAERPPVAHTGASSEARSQALGEKGFGWWVLWIAGLLMLGLFCLELLEFLTGAR